MTWQKLKIWDFLTERKERMTPEEANISGISRLEKIDFSGTIHVKEWKNTNTWMILVYPWDLVISGINVEKGALAVYEWDEKILATIHYSSYQYNPQMIDIEYLRYFARSFIFRKIILEQVWWGIKTEIKAKKFLSLEISLPDLDSQKEIVKVIQWVESEIEMVNSITERNIKLSKQLKSSILQDAIQWKLVPQDPSDEPASILIERIQAEKTKLIAEWKLKKQKPLAPIKTEEIPYELPKGWEVGEIRRCLNLKKR
jgi:type I restriction enzyme S subunit